MKTSPTLTLPVCLLAIANATQSVAASDDHQFTTQELEDVVLIMRRAEEAFETGYNPQDMVRAVNELLPHGKEKVLAAIETYLGGSRNQSSQWTAMAVLRTAFQVPQDAKHMPKSFTPAENEYLEHFPRYPIVIYADIPFFLVPVSSWSSSGGMPTYNDHVDFYREKAQLRGAPLVPTDRPMRVLHDFASSSKWVFRVGQLANDHDHFARLSIKWQLLTMVESVYHLENGEWREDRDLRQRILDDWDDHVAAVGKLEVHWHTQQQKYVFADGTSLPNLPPASYQRQVWMIEVPDHQLWVILQRKSGTVVDIEVERTIPGIIEYHPTTFRVIDPQHPDVILAEIELEGGPTGGFRGMRRSVRLPKGGRIQVEMHIDGVRMDTRTFEP